LGSQFLLNSNISIIFSPHKFDNFADEKLRIFYLTPFSMIHRVQQMANYPDNQNPNITMDFEYCMVPNKNKLNSSDPSDYKKIIDKGMTSN
jgi:hypothetical protein